MEFVLILFYYIISPIFRGTFQQLLLQIFELLKADDQCTDKMVEEMFSFLPVGTQMHVSHMEAAVHRNETIHILSTSFSYCATRDRSTLMK